jgi:RimJ/RimL family protein N-acetyltransferase
MSNRSFLVPGDGDWVQRWVAERIPDITAFGDSVSLAAVSGNHILAGFVFHDYHPDWSTISMSMASESPMWARREIIHGVLSYPFEQLKTYKLWAAILRTNEKMLKAATHIGFIREAILAHQFGQKRHAVIMRMLQPDYQRLFGEYGHEKQTIAA